MLTDEQLQMILPSVQEPYKLQTSVARLRQQGSSTTQAAVSQSRFIGAASANFGAAAAFPACGPDSIIDTSPNATCTPAYPDPTNSAWQNLVNPPITFGAFSPSDYPSVSMQSCGLTVESNLVQTVSALNGTVTVAAIACGALPVIASNICFGATAVIGVAGAVAQGIFRGLQ